MLKLNTLVIISCITLSACSEAPKLEEVKQQSLKDFIFVQGGTFTMGDFGTIINGERGYYTMAGLDQQPPHQVTLSNYSLAKNKVTWFEYDTFLLSTGRKVQYIDFKDPDDIDSGFHWGSKRQPYQLNENVADYEPNNFYLKKPATVQWQDAKNYCQWLGKEMDLSIDLATEAQWEYAARSGGKEVLFSNSLVDITKNPGKIYIEDIPSFIGVGVDHWGALKPIGTLSTPNHLGFVDMDTNGNEWVNDWYSKTYFTDYPTITNPKGPDTGTEKVTKLYKFTFDRRGDDPSALFHSFRCAVNSDKPITK